MFVDAMCCFKWGVLFKQSVAFLPAFLCILFPLFQEGFPFLVSTICTCCVNVASPLYFFHKRVHVLKIRLMLSLHLHILNHRACMHARKTDTCDFNENSPFLQ